MTYTNWSRLVYTQATKKRVSKGEQYGGENPHDDLLEHLLSARKRG
ncbi:MAG: hypothetical protein ACLRTI_11265 [Blautia sp.]